LRFDIFGDVAFWEMSRSVRFCILVDFAFWEIYILGDLHSGRCCIRGDFAVGEISHSGRFAFGEIWHSGRLGIRGDLDSRRFGFWEMGVLEDLGFCEILILGDWILVDVDCGRFELWEI